MIRKSPFLHAICLNLFFLFLYIAFGQIRHGSLDDYFMSSVLTGAYGGEYDVHMYFVNSAYGCFLKPFYWLFPKVGWYFIFELIGTFTAFTTLIYFVIRQLGPKYGIPLSSILLASLTPDFYFQLSFTQCATLYTAAGLVAISFAICENKKKFFVLAGLFLFAGSVMRYEGFLLGTPFLCFLLATKIYETKRISLQMVIAFCIILFSIWGVREYNHSLYTEGEYKYYAAYQPIRAYFGDGAFYDRESTFDELEERGMSGQDFNLLKTWMFYDTEVFQIDSLTPIKNIAQNNLFEPNPKRMATAFLLSISNSLTRCSGWCWVLFCILLIFSSSKISNIYPWISLSFICICIGYLLVVNRLVYHVESGVWLYAIASTIPFVRQEKYMTSGLFLKIEKMTLLIIVLIAAGFTYIGVSNQEHLKKHLSLIESPEMPKDWQNLLSYVKKHPNDVFLLSYSRYKELGSFKNPAYRAIEPGSWDNIFSWGYWNIHLPSMQRELKKRGVQNPIHDIVHNNVYVLENDSPSLLEDFYKVHYHRAIHADTSAFFGKLILRKYKLKDDSL